MQFILICGPFFAALSAFSCMLSSGFSDVKKINKIAINAFVLTFDIYVTDCSENSYHKKLFCLDLNTALLKSKFRLHKCSFFTGKISKLVLGQTKLTCKFSGMLIFGIL